MISCSSYESSSDGSGDSGSCIGVLPGTVLFFGVAGALFGAINEHSSKFRIKPVDTETLRPLSRFPQGIPDSARVLWPAFQRH